mgnify:CR=1 FL=1
MPGRVPGQNTQPFGPQLKQALIAAAPLFSSMAAGYSSGRGPYAYMDQGIAGMQALMKQKRDEEAAAAAAAAFGGLVPGGMGASVSTKGGGGSGGGAPFVYTPSQPMPKANVGVMGGGQGGLGFAGKPAANPGVYGAQGGLGFSAPGSGDPTLGLIKQFEGFRETPYWDVNALRTGYGSDTVTLADGSVQRVGEGTRVSREDADRDLQRRVNQEFMPIAAKAVGPEVFATLAPNQKAALTSIAYNYGELPGSVAAAVRSGDPRAAAEAIAALGSHNDGINADRRQKEAAFFLSGSTGQDTTMMAKDGAVIPADPMADPYIQRLMQVMAMPGLTPEQRSVVELQLQTRMGQLTAPPPEAPKPIEVGGVLLDPITMQPIFDSRTPKAEPRPMTAQERMAWGIPETDKTPYKMTDTGPVAIGGGGVTVNNDMGGGKFEEAFAKGDAATIETVYNSGLSAQRNLGRIDQLESVLAASPTGMEGAIKQVAGEWGIATEGLDAIQSAQALVNSLVPEQRQPGSGPMSDADLALFKESLPRIINQPGGNKIIIGTMRAIAQYDAEGAKIVQRLRNGELTRAQAFDALQNRVNPLSEYAAGVGGGAVAPVKGVTQSGVEWSLGE